MDTYKEYNTDLFSKYIHIYLHLEKLLFLVRKRVANSIRAQSYVLDVACGTGDQAFELAQRGHTVVGIDLSPDMVRVARKKNHWPDLVTFIEGDATQMPFPDSTFDVSLISFALHDMPVFIRTNVLKEMKRVTKPGGEIIVIDYNNNPSTVSNRLLLQAARLWESRYYRSFLHTYIHSHLKEAGLPVVEEREWMQRCVKVIRCTCS